MIGTIRRHTKWLWWFIIIAMSFSLVWYFIPSRRNGGGGMSEGPVADLGKVFDRPVTPQERGAALRESRLFYRLRTGEWPSAEQEAQIEHLADQRVFLDAELRAHKIDVTDQAAARYAKQMLGVPANEAMPTEKLNQFVQNELMARGQLGFADFERFVRHQAGQEYLISLYGMSGKLITAKEAEFFYRRENEPMMIETVSFPASSYYAQTAPTEEQIKNFFTNHEADYRIPERIQVNYIAFDTAKLMPDADKQLGTNIDERIADLYHQQPTDAYKDENGKALNEKAAEAMIKSELRNRTALSLAEKDAEAFVSDLAQGHDDDHPYTPADLSKLATAKGLKVILSPAFDEKTGTPGINVSPLALHSLFQLRSDDPDDKERSMLYAPPVIGTNAVYVAGLAKRLPSQLRTLAEVREQVIKDYRQEESMKLAREAGERFAAALQAGLAQGKSFNDICSAQFVKPKSLPAFSVTTQSIPEIPDKAAFQELQSACFNIPAGQGTRLIPNNEGGIVAFVRSRLPVDEATMKKQLPEYLQRMRQQRQIAAFEEWFGREMQLHYSPPPSERSGSAS